MGKRSDFARERDDFYRTPVSAVIPLLPHILDRQLFIEPCAGDGALIDHLERFGGRCVEAWDINPRRKLASRADARTAIARAEVGIFITNPPWARDVLHPIITNLTNQRTTWLLVDADWMHTRQAAPFIPRCSLAVSIGRVKWIDDSPHTGKDNCCWFRFSPDHTEGPRFVGRY